MRLIFPLAAVLFFNLKAYSFMTYLPDKHRKESLKVIVVIHGCLQSSESMALGTGWNSLADENNLMIIYPQVPSGTNPLDCWNWYLPENQSPKEGQLKLIKDQIDFYLSSFGISKSTPIYVTGISSGGAITAGLLACFPKYFRAGAIHSAPPFGLAKNLVEGAELLTKGPSGSIKSKSLCSLRDFSGKLMVLQGLKDKVVHPGNALALIEQFVPKKVKLKIEKKKSYKLKRYLLDSKEFARLIEFDDLGHAWSGFEKGLRKSQLVGPKSGIPTKIPFFDSGSVSSTELIWKFFLSN